MKKCISCKTEKEDNEFWHKSRNKDSLQNMCKVCKRLYDNEYHNQRSKENKIEKCNQSKKRRKGILKRIGEYACALWCIDCWYNENMAALQFDHLHDKEDSISNLARGWSSIETILQEIKKCEVRCANCHAIKTALDYNWYK